jgi:D-beta-D-heptose 7-phosphate kinase/D-beta-D-heptose 1-phosphate adenosyltransferase|tara:strand:- start:1406 stop:2140 length:735 start_codon:yes stop_codon:yes gene_type:complete
MMMKILVIGDSCTDTFIYGECDRMCPEAPVPVFHEVNRTMNGGMASNVVKNLQSLNVDTKLITQNQKIVKARYCDLKTNHLFLRVDSDKEKVSRIRKKDIPFLDDYDAIVISDYNKGFLEEEDIEYICNKTKRPVFLDTKKHIGDYCKKVSFIKINEYEYETTKNTLKGYENKLIVTLGSRGALYRNKIYKIKSVDIMDVSGAGDTFLAAFVFLYIKSNNIVEAIRFANDSAMSVVQKRGVSVL